MRSNHQVILLSIPLKLASVVDLEGHAKRRGIKLQFCAGKIKREGKENEMRLTRA